MVKLRYIWNKKTIKKTIKHLKKMYYKNNKSSKRIMAIKIRHGIKASL